jgi:hypothetical protein
VAGWRDGRAAICVAEQRGDQFSAASKIFNSNANDRSGSQAESDSVDPNPQMNVVFRTRRATAT